MNKVYCVSYDLNKLGQRYSALYEELKQSPYWWHYLDSTWLIATNETATQLSSRLRKRIDSNDYILAIEVRRNADGWLKQEAWNWINNHVPI